MIVNRLKEAERKLRTLMISTVLEKHKWDYNAAADELGITRDALTWNIRQLKINPIDAEVLADRMRHVGDQANKARPNQHERKAGSQSA